MSGTPPMLEMSGIAKAFPGILALDHVDFDCRAGEVHAICGENGAGKSTLMKVLGGSYRADAGEVRLAGKAVRFLHPVEAQRAGISIIHQELSLLPYRSVVENIFMGHEIARRGLLDRRRMRARSAALLERLGAAIDPDLQVSELSIAQQQLVEIAKALLMDARVLVMDEPTAALDERDAQALLALVRGLKDEGVAIVYISHRMPEVMAIADRVSVLKDGRKVWTRPREGLEVGDIVRAMVGRDLKDFYPAPRTAKPGKVLLSVAGGANALLRGINLEIHAGEIVGVAGLEDSGKAQLAQAVIGDRPFLSGSIEVKGSSPSSRRIRRSRAASATCRATASARGFCRASRCATMRF